MYNPVENLILGGVTIVQKSPQSAIYAIFGHFFLIF